MTKTNHSSEPWVVARNPGFHDITIYGLDAEGVARQWICNIPYSDMGKANLANYQANARRIVAAVNACTGFTTEELERIAANRDDPSAMLKLVEHHLKEKGNP